MIKLTLTEKGGEPRVLTFDKDEITIGRVTGNDIVLAKGNISKRHTRLTKRDGGMEIADLKSTNGTFVNGRKIAGPTNVAPSDRIYVGDFLIGIDGPAGAMAEPGGLHSSASTSSASRRLPVPPPPPPPARGGSSAARLPDEDEESSSGEDARFRRRRPRPRSGRRRRSPADRWVSTTTSRSVTARPPKPASLRTTPATSGCSSTRAAATRTATPGRGVSRREPDRDWAAARSPRRRRLSAAPPGRSPRRPRT
jgi:pSer/pThr/pTyr-binding forkhead associated (FHA) protein